MPFTVTEEAMNAPDPTGREIDFEDWSYEAPFRTGEQDVTVIWIKDDETTFDGFPALRVSVGTNPIPGAPLNEQGKPTGARIDAYVPTAGPKLRECLRSLGLDKPGTEIKPGVGVGRTIRVTVGSYFSEKYQNNRATVDRWHPFAEKAAPASPLAKVPPAPKAAQPLPDWISDDEIPF